MPAIPTDRRAMIALIERMIAQIQAMLEKLREEGTLQEQLYLKAKATIGRDASPSDLVHDDLGCAESVTNIIDKVIEFPIITGTWTLWDTLQKDPRFARVSEANGRGTIVLSPTGTGNGKIRGHVGIMGDGKAIMSADSRDGVWRENYTVEAWSARYRQLGGFPVYFYAPI